MIETGGDVELFRATTDATIGMLGRGDRNNPAMYRRRLMAEHQFDVHLNYPEPVDIRRGDYVIIYELKMSLRTDPKPIFNSDRKYEYTLSFEAPEMFLQDNPLFYTFQGLDETSWSLTSQPENFMKIFVENANRFIGGEFTVGIVEPQETISLQFDGVSIWDGLTSLAEAVDCEWYVDYLNNTFNLVKNYEFGKPYEFKEDEVVIDMRQSNANDEDYFTRMLVFGGTRNIPRNYRSPGTGTAVDAIVQKQLRMPESYGNYINLMPDLPEYLHKTKIVTFEHIYPKRISQISDIKINDTQTDENGNPFIVYYIKDEGLQFKSEYILPGETLQLTFEIGSWLAGRTFELKYHDSGTYEGYFEIINDQTIPDLIIPNDVLKPRVGDKFVLFGFDIQLVSDQYIPEAEEELKKEALAYAESMLGDNATYTCTMNSTHIAENKLFLDVGHRVKIVSDIFKDGYKLSRINEIEWNLAYWNHRYVVGAKPEYYKNTRNLRESVARNKQIADLQYVEAMKANKQNFKTVQALNYLRTALENSTVIDGGLILTTLIQLGLLQGDTWVNTAGINGVYENDESVAYWAGGTLDQAVNAVNNPQATEDVANYVVTHGGKAIMNEALVRGRFESNINGNRVIIDPENRKITLMNTDDKLLLSIGFEETTIGDVTLYLPKLLMNNYFGENTPTYVTEMFGDQIRLSNTRDGGLLELSSETGIKYTKGDSLFEVIALNDLRVVTQNLPTNPDSITSGEWWNNNGVPNIKQ